MRLWFFLPFFVVSLFAISITANEPDLLKSSDIGKIMKQILEQRLDNSKMTSQVIHNALLTYIDQFDPHHIYLLQSEVQPYEDLSSQQIDQLIDQYKKNDFSVFKQIDEVIQRAIIRSRKLRPAIEEKAKQTLFQVHPKESDIPRRSMDPHTFAKDEKELENRIENNLAEFILGQRKRYSVPLLAQRKDQTIHSYESHLRQIENQYLFEDENDHSLSPSEKENLFSIHVLKALANTLDAHTSFYEANEAYEMRVHLEKEFEGIGLVLQDNPAGILVTSMLADSPAEKSGLIKKGDILVRIDGKVIEGEPFEKVMESLHDSKKPEVALEFRRKDEQGGADNTITVKLTRTLIELKNDRVDVSAVNFGNGIIGIIKLHAFYQGDTISSEKDMREAIRKLESKHNLKGLILDLRSNTGGFLSQAVKVAGLFIKDGVIVISKYTDGEEKIFRDVNSKESYDGPLVVLTSKLTASAAEIVTQALQDYGLALVVGDEHTYGKGTIQTQTVTDNRSSSYFKVTVGKYYTASGKTPQKEGVKADIIVPSHLNKERIGEKYVVGAEPADRIPPMFDDKLEGISPDIKSWYLKYYVPNLQKVKTEWRNMLPILKKNSEYRIAHNKDYQFYLKGSSAGNLQEDSSLEEEMEPLESKNKNYGVDDLQLIEAENIVKDMILLKTVEATKK